MTGQSDGQMTQDPTATTKSPPGKPEVVVAQSAQYLLPLLAERLRAPLSDPFLPDIIVVPTAGTRDWLIEQLGHHLDDGRGEAILANVHFWFPNEFNLHAIGIERAADDPWAVKRLRWTLLGLLTDDPSLAPGFANAKSPLATAQRIAELFDRYSVYRPEMPASWAVGTEADPVQPIRADKQWQYRLWQEVRDRVGPSTGERFISARGALNAEAAKTVLPGRLSVFGLDVYSPAKVSLLAELFALVDVSIYSIFPALSRIPDLRSLDLGDHLRSHHDLANAMRFPLLRSWSRAGLESMAILGSSFSAVNVLEVPKRLSLLGRLQTAVANDSPLPVPLAKTELLAKGDGSIEVHRCHGATRQVEVLRDALLHRLAADPTLHPRDVIVVCPDLETYAPLLGPVLGAEFFEPVNDSISRRLQLPIAIIDKTTSTSTPVADAIEALFDVVANRLERSKVLGLLAMEPVRRRFGIDDDGFSTIQRWADDLDVHWGVDGEYRSVTPWSYPSSNEAGTWRIAIDRLLNGVLVQSQEPRETLSGVVAYDDISGSSIDVVGALAAFIGELCEFADFCSSARSAEEWGQALEKLFVGLFDVPFDDRSQLADALKLAHELHAQIASSAGSALLSHREVASYFARELDDVRARSRVWGDVVRIASLSRLRGVPARVVAILGFDDRAFTTGRGIGDDILSDASRLAERDFHAEERLGLLNLLTAASEAVLITCNGFDVTNNKELPMAVPLAEFVDAVASIIDGTEGQNDSYRPVLISHTRQLTDPLNFGNSSIDDNRNVGSVVDGPWTFDPIAATVARRISEVSNRDPQLVDWPDFPWDPFEFDRTSLSIQTLTDAFRRPSEFYVRERLQISLPRSEATAKDQIDLWPGSRSYSAMAAEVIEARRTGRDIDEIRHIRTLSGGVPIGELADRFWEELIREVGKMLSVENVDYSLTETTEIELSVGDATIIDTLVTAQRQIVAVTFSEDHRRHRIRPWLELAARTTIDPAADLVAVVIARKKKTKAPFALHRFAMAGNSPEERHSSAQKVLWTALEMHRRALCSPLPVFEYASWSNSFKPTPIDTGLGFDLARGPAELLFGSRRYLEFMDRSDPVNALRSIDSGFVDGITRFQAYWSMLEQCFSETTVKK